MRNGMGEGGEEVGIEKFMKRMIALWSEKTTRQKHLCY